MRPRPVLLFVLAFEAGLATGLSRFLDPLLVIPALVLPLLLGGPSPWKGWPLLALLGLGFGALARAAQGGDCALVIASAPVIASEAKPKLRDPKGRSKPEIATGPSGPRDDAIAEIRLTIRLREPVADGVAAVRVDGCRGEITARFRGTELREAGSRWEVEGRWIPSRRFGGKAAGLLVVRRASPLESSPSFSERIRTWLAGTVAHLYGTRAGLVEALLVGRRGGIDPSVNAEFARSGLVHLLSISGFHVGIVFVWASLLFRQAGAQRGLAGALASALVFGYVAFLGWPAPAARAAFLAGISAWCVFRQRQPAAIPLLAVTCLGVTIVDPWAIFDLGGWLSAAAFSGALIFTRWSDRALGEHAGWRMLFASLGATVATAPLTAAALGSVALAGLLLNFAAIPLAAVAVPAVIGSVVVAPLSLTAAAFLAAGGGFGLAGLEGLARFGSALPVGAFQMAPGLLAALPWLLVLAATLWILGRRNTSRRAALRGGWVVGAVGVATALPVGRWFSPDLGSGLSLHFLSVGQGDAALIRTPAGRWILIDAGPADERRDAGREVILPYLVRHGVRRLSAFVLSHAHLDHVGGAPAVFDRIPVDFILEPALPVAEPHYLRMLDQAEAGGFRWRPARAGDSLVVDGVHLVVLHPDTAWSGWREDLNDDSLVLLVRMGAFEALFAGDLGVKAESALAGRLGRVDLLKVGHHGSAGSSGERWLEELRPRAAVVSVGVNRYGHPSPSALERLARAGVEVWRTDRDGTMSVRVTDSTMTLRGRRAVRSYPLRP
ncbi:MAG: DNA internalization-related competence protein ComEC/Rec2 [Gemmatimonadales bacterium]|nr:DNA internalization-related competence protein ComEC/Rec2 [Gemmatimonadales bacterium]